MSTLQVYGIPNCNTVKKALDWLNDNGITYQFHNFKKEPPTLHLLQNWAKQLGWQRLLNQKGTTWRQLDDSQRLLAENEAGAYNLMLEKSSVIKRPVIVYDNKIIIGFNEQEYQEFFVA